MFLIPNLSSYRKFYFRSMEILTLEEVSLLTKDQ